MRILILNFRDLSNPVAGGAEVFTEEIAVRLAEFGNEVTLFTSAFDGCEQETFRSGLRIIRKGGKYSVYNRGRAFAKKNLSDFDIIVDEINTVPFHAPKIARGKPVVALIHQLAREIWFYEARFPLSLVGYFALEPLWLREYRNIPTITVSNSTKADLLTRGFRHVDVVHNGISVPPIEERPKKESQPVLIFLGRLVRSKRPDHAILAFRLIKSSFPAAQLWIVGDGYMRRKLEAMQTGGVTFFGRLTNEEKFRLLKKSHLLIAPSVREGWGTSVIEANAMGTPAIGYRVPGLTESVVENVTGVLVEPGNYKGLSIATTNLLTDLSRLENMSMNAIEWSKTFTWDRAAKDFFESIQLHSRASTIRDPTSPTIATASTMARSCAERAPTPEDN